MSLKPDLSVNIADIKLQNPIIPASGTFGFGAEYADFFDLRLLGALVTKGITLEPRDGNPQPRIWETSCGMINSIGLENPGIKRFISEKMPFMRQFGLPIIVNISGFSADEFSQLAKALDKVEGVSGLEVNISCPNVEHGGMAFGVDPTMASKITIAVKNSTHLPVIVKLTPNVTDIADIALFVERSGADALSLINTVQGAFISNGKIKIIYAIARVWSIRREGTRRSAKR